MTNAIDARIARVRQVMADAGVDAVIVPQTDPHQSEYLADHWELRRYLTGFTGSAGTLVVTADDARLWVDSRYFIQGAAQTEGTCVTLMKILMPGVPTIEEWLCEKLDTGAVVGVDGMLFSISSAEKLAAALAEKGIDVDTDFDIADRVWPDRPALPADRIFIHEVKYAGVGADEKLAIVRKFADDNHTDAVFISALDEIAWTLNIRCNDVEYNPVATAYLYVGKDSATLFVDPVKVDADVETYLKKVGVEVAPYGSVKTFLASLPEDEKVAVDTAATSVAVFNILGARAVAAGSPVAVAKACKNEVEIAGFRAAHERDGAALVRAFMEIERRLAEGVETTELDVDEILHRHRSAMPLFVEDSFATIAGYAEHGAIVHYEATEETSVPLKPEGLLLVDTGAQYLDGTTDITRTVALGTPTAQEKHDFTLVLKGHIALAMMVYPVGTHGVQLDAEARKFLWREGLGYMHGTGHGVGCFLNVHEGPQTIRMNYTPVPLMAGMITSNEPGLYREGMHGIRCENLVLSLPAMTTDFGDFLKFENITLFPFDTALLEMENMTTEEIDWLNAYHSEVYRRVSPLLNDDERKWLKAKTAKIEK